MTRLACLILAAAFALPAAAQERQIREALEPKLGGAKIESIQATPIKGLYEVQVRMPDGPRIIYMDEQGGYLFMGRIVDLKNDRDLTEERMQRLTAIEFGKLPLDLAVKIQRGNGKRQLAMFSDPYCPYCRRLEQTLLQIDDITVYVFMYPVIRPDLADHSRAVWCSKDRAKAWLDLASLERPKVPAASPGCANPVDKVIELGKSLRVTGTPTVYFANGERASAAWTVEQLRAKLDETARQAQKKN
jgi:thiol:disulfide interchange protein DsbC